MQIKCVKIGYLFLHNKFRYNVEKLGIFTSPKKTISLKSYLSHMKAKSFLKKLKMTK